MKATLYFGLLALVLSTLILGLNLTSKNPYINENSINKSSIHTISPNKDVKILNSQIMETNDGKFIVNGQVQNIGHYKMRYVSITVNFYDKKGNLLYSSFDSKSFISPGEIWNFEVPYRKPMVPYSYKTEVGPTKL